jgi:prophage antirepressor-like protein
METQRQSLFKYDDKDVRVIMKDTEPWFVAKDICEILDLSNTSMAIDKLDDDEKDNIKDIDSVGRKHNVSIINEPGLYSLVLRSNKPEAKRFKRFVTHEILPSIRKHGAYMTEDIYEKISADPDFGIKLLTDLKNERARVKLLDEQRKYAELTKSWISDKQTATAMNTASQLSKENTKLRTELGLSKDYASIKCVQIITGESYDWRKLIKHSKSHNINIRKIPDPNFGEVNIYHKSVWYDCYNVCLNDLID